MGTVFDWIKKYSNWLVLVLLEGISLYLLVSFNAYQGSVWFTAANSVAGTVMEWEHGIVSYIHLGEVNARLTRQNVIYEQELERMRSEIASLRHDSSFTERTMTRKLDICRTLRAHVVNNSIVVRDNYLTIDRGAKDGVREEMGVVSGTGIVGIVTRVTAHRAVVMPVLNSHSNISCRLRGSNYFGYLRWYGVSPMRASLDDIPRHARFKVGDAVETSGFSNVFPAGLFVGRVVKVNDSADGMSYQLTVLLSTDIAKVRDVEVILSHPEKDIVNNDTTDIR